MVVHKIEIIKMYKCKTNSVDDLGNHTEKQKKPFRTLDGAIAHAKIMNSLEERTEKVVAYKCKTCHKYHVGRNGNTIKDKDRVKIQKSLERPKSFKIVGKIDLSTIPKK